MAYVLGFFAADGFITHNKRGANFWCIQITDKKLLEEIKRVIQAEHKISKRTRRENEKTIYRLQIGSIEMCDDLRRLGFSERKTKSLAVPHVPKKYFSHFVRGYFDGDGNVWVGHTHKDRNKPSLTIRTMFTSCSVRFLISLHDRLMLFGIRGGCIYNSKDNYSRLQFGSGDSLKLYDFMYNQGAFFEDSLFLERKKIVFEKYRIAKKKCGRGVAWLT